MALEMSVDHKQYTRRKAVLPTYFQCTHNSGPNYVVASCRDFPKLCDVLLHDLPRPSQARDIRSVQEDEITVHCTFKLFIV